MKKYKHFVKWLILVPLVIILGYCFFVLYSRSIGGNELPMPFGYGLAVVTSGSMDPTLSVDDLVIAKEPEDIKVGDNIIFESHKNLIIHRVKKIIVNSKSVSHLSKKEFKTGFEQSKLEEIEPANNDRHKIIQVVTKGDANNVVDEPIWLRSIKGVYVDKVAGVGQIVRFFQSIYGCLIILLTLVAVFWISNKRERKRAQEQEEAKKPKLDPSRLEFDPNEWNPNNPNYANPILYKVKIFFPYQEEEKNNYAVNVKVVYVQKD